MSNVVTFKKRALGDILEEMRILGDSQDIEGLHTSADKLLCDALIISSMSGVCPSPTVVLQIVEAFNDLKKWYG